MIVRGRIYVDCDNPVTQETPENNAIELKLMQSLRYLCVIQAYAPIHHR
jgi:hypothetical protein